MSSSKVMFRLETLKAEALKSIDFRIQQKRLEVESYDDDAALEERRAEWRAAQEQRISELFSRLGQKGITDEGLAAFKIDPIPEVDRWDRSKAEHDLSRLQSLRTQIVAKTEALVADDAGNISLTKTQLAEFFGL